MFVLCVACLLSCFFFKIKPMLFCISYIVRSRSLLFPFRVFNGIFFWQRALSSLSISYDDDSLYNRTFIFIHLNSIRSSIRKIQNICHSSFTFFVREQPDRRKKLLKQNGFSALIEVKMILCIHRPATEISTHFK